MQINTENVTVRSSHSISKSQAATEKNDPTVRDLFDLMQSMERNLGERLSAIEHDLKERVSGVETSLELAHHRVDELEGKVAQLERELVKSQGQQLKDQILNELRSKEYNLLLHGIPQQSDNESAEETENVFRAFVADTLRFPSSSLEKIKCANIHRLPRRNSTEATTSGQTKKPPPIVVKFVNMCDKRAISALASRARTFNASITRHLPISMQIQRKKLIRQANIFHKQGKNIRWKIVDADYCLFVNGERYYP